MFSSKILSDTARFGERLYPRSYVDTVAVEVAALNHDIAEVDADAQHEPPILGNILVGGIHGLLQLDGAGDRVRRAGELYQHAVSHHFDDSAMMRGDQWLSNFSATGLERSESAGLVHPHQAAVADHIGSKNGSKPTLGAFFGHLAPFVLHAAMQQIVVARPRGVYRVPFRSVFDLLPECAAG